MNHLAFIAENPILEDGFLRLTEEERRALVAHIKAVDSDRIINLDTPQYNQPPTRDPKTGELVISQKLTTKGIIEKALEGEQVGQDWLKACVAAHTS